MSRLDHNQISAALAFMSVLGACSLQASAEPKTLEQRYASVPKVFPGSAGYMSDRESDGGITSGAPSYRSAFSGTVSTKEVSDSAPTGFNQSRVEVGDSDIGLEYPYRTIGTLRFFSDGVSECTGALIGPGLVLTSSECFSGAVNPSSVLFAPAFKEESDPFRIRVPFGGAWRATEVLRTKRTRPGDENCSLIIDDCTEVTALVRLETKQDRFGNEIRLGEKIGWMGFSLEPYGFEPAGEVETAPITRFDYHELVDDGLQLLRTDAIATYLPDLGVLTTPSRPSIEEQIPARMIVSRGGGPWVVNFGERPEVSEFLAPTTDAEPNVIVAVTAVFNGTGEINVGPLGSSNFAELYQQACDTEPRDCYLTGDETDQSGIRLELEEPVNGGTYTGIGNLRGWSVDDFVVHRIEAFIDGEYAFEIPFGSERLDVGSAFPEVYESNNSGFAQAFNYGALDPGEHTITVVATNRAGESVEDSATFQVAAFHKPFIEADDVISVEDAQYSGTGNTLRLEGVSIDGKDYDLSLQWDTATQGFEITSIVERPEN